MKKFKLALLQTKCVISKHQNIQYITQALATAGRNGTQISILGEICNSPYMKKYIHEHAQNINNSPTIKAIQQQCKQHKMYAIGTIPNKHDQHFYNTAFVINPHGQLQEQFNKLHLLDIDIPRKITIKESEIFTAGDKICVFDTEYCRIGLGICYDLRFAELGLLMRQKGATMLVYPGSFNQITGPLHWQLLLRERALDNQCFVAGVSVAQYKQNPYVYQAWGHSTLVDPLGKVLIAFDENPHIAYSQIDGDYLQQVRTQIPIFKQKRNDIYKLKEL